MSTWVMHLRVAEKLQHLLDDIDEAAYYVGAIAPDSGRMVDDFTYLPPKDVSHWKRDGVSFEQRFLDNAEFYKKFCEKETDKFKKSLFWGYYVHILTDTIYVRDIIHPYIAEHGWDHWKANITNIRKGWYEIDFRFLAENPNYKPFELLKTVGFFENTFFDYFAPTDIYDRIQNAIELYSNATTDINCKFITHTPEYAIELSNTMTSEISKILINHI